MVQLQVFDGNTGRLLKTMNVRGGSQVTVAHPGYSAEVVYVDEYNQVQQVALYPRYKLL